MALLQYKKYLWLMETIHASGRITKEEIDRKWYSSSVNENHDPKIPDSTFFRNLKEIQSFFDIEIKCDRSTGQYYMDDSDLNSQTKQWLLTQFAVSQSLDTSRELRDRIVYEPIPAGTEYLTTIVNAMRDNRWLHIVHQRFDSDAAHTFYIAPFCLKVFKQRWYIFGVKCEVDEPLAVKASSTTRIYALDRVKSLEPTEHTFKMPKSFHAPTYFSNYYGVFCGPDYKPEVIRARFGEKDAPYVRTLPLHYSQKEVEPCVFEWFVAPTFDFIQQLRTYSYKIEILAPQSLREQFAKDAKKVLDLYGPA